MGKAWSLNSAIAFGKKVFLSAITGCFFPKKTIPFFCHKSEPSKQYMAFRIIWRKFATIANLATNQEPTLDITNISPLYIYIYIYYIFMYMWNMNVEISTIVEGNIPKYLMIWLILYQSESSPYSLPRRRSPSPRATNRSARC